MRDLSAAGARGRGARLVPISLLSFGGSNAVIADIEHQTVAVHQWMTGREFADFFALTRAAPGPGSMLTALIGWKVAGLAGALVATIGYYLPAAVLVYALARLWGRWRGRRWHGAIERGTWRRRSPPGCCSRPGSRYCARRREAGRSGLRRLRQPRCCCAGLNCRRPH